MNCPGSVEASRGIPKVVNQYMTEGTAAHAVLEMNLRGEYLQGDVVEWQGEAVAVTDEMLEAVAVAERFVREWDDPDSLLVADYKHGKGVVVPVKGNKQLLFYGIGVWAHLPRLAPGLHTEIALDMGWIDPRMGGTADIVIRGSNKFPSYIDLAIIQPRAQSEPKLHRISLAELLDFEVDLREAVKRIDREPNKRVAGDWCRFCPAFPVCAEARNRVANITIKPYAPIAAGVDKSPFDLDALALALDQSGYVEEWLKAVWSLGEKLALSGTKIPRYKLVNGRSSRTWGNPGQAIAWLTQMQYAPEKFMTEPVLPALRSPAQVEKIITSEEKQELAKFIDVVPGKPTLVSEQDKRPAIDVSLPFQPLGNP